MNPAALLGADPATDPGELVGLCLARLGQDPPAEQAALLLAAVRDLTDDALRRTREGAAARAARVVDCERALGRLRTVVSATALVQRACDELAAACGFERVLLSRVEDGAWRPWRVNQLVHGEAWFSAWEDSEIPFADLVLESRLLTEHRPAVVLDTADAHPFFLAGESPSYVVAPLAAGGRAIGFFHADHGTDGPACDETDRDVLWAFAEGFAHLYERTVLLERVRGQHEQVRRTLGLVDGALQRLTASDIDLVLVPDEEPTRAAVGDFSDLTPRELDVLAVLATGASNEEIAARLVLSTGTVKTHVKHVLAKLGVLNRAQAIARWAEQSPPTGEDHPPVGERETPV